MASKSYFSHDSNARNSKKMIRMRQRLGGERAAAAYGIYWMLIERLREEEGYVCDLDYEMLSFDFRVDEDLIRTVVEDFDLFEISEDGTSFSCHGLEERMESVEHKSAAGKKGAAARWGNRENTDKMAQNGENMADVCDANSNKIKLNKRKENKRNYSSSLSSSLNEADKESEEQKEEILSFFFFEKNWAAPSEELDKFIAYNNRPGSIGWDNMSDAEKKSAAMLWQQKPQKQPHLDERFLDGWFEVYQRLKSTDAPATIRMAALDDAIAYKIDGKKFLLCCPAILHHYLEEHLEVVKPVLAAFLEPFGCKLLTYSHTD